jgi:hypothetical protein
MSHSGLLVGNIFFNKPVNMDLVNKITDLLELPDPINYKSSNEFLLHWKSENSYCALIEHPDEIELAFVNLSWGSHIGEEEFDELEKYKSQFKNALVSYYYLEEADLNFQYDEVPSQLTLSSYNRSD